MRYICFLLTTALFAQTNDRPIVVHLNPPSNVRPTKQVTSQGLPDLKILDAAQQELAKDQNLNRATMPAPSTQPMPVPMASNLAKAPKDYRPRKDIPLDENAKKSVAISEHYSTQSNYPTEGKDGSVLFTFGAGEPKIVCAPLRLSVIELEKGEKLRSKPQPSDETRWDVITQLVGTQADEQSLILLRPHEPGLEANLVFTTDRRVYYLRLISKPTEYMARISFQYQNTTSEKSWQDYQIQLAAYEVAHPKEETKKTEAGKKTDSINCDYRNSGYQFKEKSGTGLVTGACDDGKETWFTLKDFVHTAGAPVFLVKGDCKHCLKPANYDVDNTVYRVHQIFSHGVLVAGTGKHQQKVEIIAPGSK